MSMAIEAIIIQDHGQEFCHQWLLEDPSTRLSIELTVSYDMVWNKRASCHIYNSIS